MIDHPDVLNKLKGIPLFAEIRDTDKNMQTLLRFCTMRTYKNGSTVFSEGESGSEMFIVYSGSVEILKRTRAGDTYTVARLKAEHNVFFGELALIDDDTRSATVLAMENSEFVVISKQDFLELGASHPAIALSITRAIARILASRLRKTTGDMITIFDALLDEIK
jgi:CRP/FNR family cyclic AMP-dependent transcriptional regulator